MIVAHVQPMTFDLFGQDETDFGRRLRYFLPNIAEQQAREGCVPVIHLLTKRKRWQLDFKGIEVHFHPCVEPPSRLGYRTRFARQLSWSMLQTLASVPADIVHFHGALSFQLMFAAVVLVARRRGIPVVASDQGVRPVRFLESWSQTFALRHADAITTCNGDNASLLSFLGADKDRIYMVPNGVDTDLFRPAAVSGISDLRPLKVVAVSRMTAEKDPMTLARSITSLCRLGHGVELTWVGQGDLRPKVAAELSPLGKNVRFIDYLAQEELPDLYRSGHVFLLTSLREAFPQVVLEAMACGLTVIGTDVPGTRDVVGEAGILVPKEDPKALAEQLAILIREPGRLTDYRKIAIRRAAGFSWSGIVEQLAGVYAKASEHKYRDKGEKRWSI